MARRTWSELEANLPDNTSGLIDAVHVREALIDSQRPHVEGRPPESTDNASDGFDVGHTWIDSSASPWPEAWRCVFSEPGFAIWARIEGPPGPQGEQGEPGPPGGGAEAFLDLADAPGDYTGQAGKAVVVNEAEDGLVFGDAPGGGGIAPADGLVVVQHGAIANTVRPTAATVYWMGSVAPDNKLVGDLWLETGAFD